jgi:1-acyl-sn-glycerol-3-phosphate acyltransferase
MLTRSETASRLDPGYVPSVALAAPGLITASISALRHPLASVSFVAELDAAAMQRVRREARALASRHGPVDVEISYVATPDGEHLLASLRDLEGIDVTVVRRPLAAPIHRPRPTPVPPRHAEPAAQATGADPFGFDAEYHASWMPVLRFFFERYWRVSVSGIENVPAEGRLLIAANHSGAVPADAAMLATALELRHPARRRLRVLYDRFVDRLPWLAPAYRKFGAVPASLTNAEELLRRDEAVGLFPEGLAALEKSWQERYRLRRFKSGTARLAIRTRSPIVPVAVVGAEEAYPVVARLYRTGDLVGVPWIPVTPLFPLCGIAGVLPLPSKWSMRFCPPIYPPTPSAGGEDDAVRTLTARVRAAVEHALGDLLATRPGVFF